MGQLLFEARKHPAPALNFRFLSATKYLELVTRCALPFPFTLGYPYDPPTTSIMSQTSSEADYQLIFDSALEVYRRKTGKDLTTHPLLGSFETCNSPDAVFAVLQTQIPGSDKHQSSGDKFLAWLNPTINVLNAFSATIGGGISLVSLYEV
jgi:hypothetical protein